MYELNESYFKTINTPIKAYWLGFIFADGHVGDKNLTIELQKRDKKHLEKLKKILKYNGPLYKSYHLTPAGEKKEYIILNISRKKFVNNIKNCGINKNKTFNPQLPDIKNKFHKYFLRGLIDGDGTIGVYKKNKRKIIVGWGIFMQQKREKDINVMDLNC